MGKAIYAEGQLFGRLSATFVNAAASWLREGGFAKDCGTLRWALGDLADRLKVASPRLIAMRSDARP
eukprot:105455-Karenia_brevis.AAC.1